MVSTQELVEDQELRRGLLAEGFDHAYLHLGALGGLAIQSEQDARDVFMLMGSLRLRGVTGNILGAGGEAEGGGAWDEAEVEEDTDQGPEGGDGQRIARPALEDAISVMGGADVRRYISPFLWQTAVAVISKDGTHGPLKETLVPIGGPIVDQCFEQNYLTYGFDSEGARKMRSEQGPMHEWAAALGVADGPADLAIVHGPNGVIMREGRPLLDFNAVALSRGRKIVGDHLVPALPDIGPGGIVEYVEQRRPAAARLPLDRAKGEDRAMRTGITQAANARIRFIIAALDAERHKIGARRYDGRRENIEKLRGEVARVVGSNVLIKEQFYP